MQAPPDTEQAPAQDDFGSANERLPENLRTNICDLAKKFCEEDRYSRRLEIQEARRSRFYWRGMQHLVWNWKTEGWQVMGPAGGSLAGQQQMDQTSVLYVTNIYQAFGLSIQAVLTQNMPSIRPEPQDAADAADIETAKSATKMKKIIEHQNDAVMLLTEMSYYAWTDSRVAAYTRFETDKRTGQPRETISMSGALETKVPITAEHVEDFVYFQHSDEYHLAIIKDEVSKMEFEQDYEQKIEGGAHGNGEDTYERTARVSVKQGVSLLSQSGDTLSHLVTRQNTWMRPAAFQMIEDPDIKKQLQETFQTGCRVRIDNGVYTGSWDESMDDCWAVLHVLPGDGQYRNSIGSSLLSVQERFNDIINITQDTYEHGLPAAWIDDKAVDSDGVSRQTSKPAARYPFPKYPGEPIAESFFFEPAASVSPDMLQYAQDLMGPLAQFLTGAFPALFGGQMENQKTASGYAMARDQAMGRIGLLWRAIKRFWARIMEQAIRCAAKNRTDDISIGIPDNSGNVEMTSVRIEELQGKIFWFPDSDENFPESFTTKSARFMQILTAAEGIPEMLSILEEPDNLEMARKLIGLDDFVIPGAESRDKQLAEINLLLKSVSTPGQSQVDPVTGVPIPGQPQSSIPIDPVFDDNAAEFESGKNWINSLTGQNAKASNLMGYMNVRLHLMEHQQILQQQEAQAMAAQAAQANMPKPPGAGSPRSAPAPHPGAPPMPAA